MSAHDLITLAYLKAAWPVEGTGRDPALRGFISSASRMVERAIGRRAIYRAPIEFAASIYTGTFANGTPALAGQPNVIGRTLVLTLDTGTAGTVAVVGTLNGQPVTKTFDAADGTKQHSLEFFGVVTSLTIAGAVGGGTIKLGTSLGYVEQHTTCGEEFAPLEWPVRNILEVNEDPSRTFGTGTQLVVNTDYLIERRTEGDFLLRMAGQLPYAWLGGPLGLKLVHSAGWVMSTVPDDLRDVCARLAMLLYTETTRSNRLGASQTTDASGTQMRFSGAQLTPELRRALHPYRRYRQGSDTGVRMYDLEAA
jgi:hypothetical protein